MTEIWAGPGNEATEQVVLTVLLQCTCKYKPKNDKIAASVKVLHRETDKVPAYLGVYEESHVG